MAILATEEKKNTAVSAETKAAENASPTVKVETTPQQSTTQTAQSNDKIYNDTMETLKTVENSAPSFVSSYDGQIEEIYNKIVNRGQFSYDFNSDPLYGQYKANYTQQGQQAMRDTMGQAAALTGGYGSSYGQAVGQQQYDAYIQRLNDVLPELYGMAYDKWNAEGDQLRSNLSIASALRDTEYNQYRDDVADKQYADAWALEQAETLAQYGDFSKYKDLYGEETANQMRLSWAAVNPDAAWAAGLLTELEYYQLTGALPRTSIPVATASSGGGGDWYGGSGSDIYTVTSPSGAVHAYTTEAAANKAAASFEQSLKDVTSQWIW